MLLLQVGAHAAPLPDDLASPVLHVAHAVVVARPVEHAVVEEAHLARVALPLRAEIAKALPQRRQPRPALLLARERSFGSRPVLLAASRVDRRQPEILGHPLDDGPRLCALRIRDRGELLRHVRGIGQHQQLVQVRHHASVCKLVAAAVPANRRHRSLLHTRPARLQVDKVVHLGAARRDPFAVRSA